ncbi:MAG: hypothetical protein OXG78_06610 [Chloroflexi bacterium]|nr:hypothetical protein [Chloroflexota bacterium]
MMEESALISAISLFAGVGLMPAVFLILRDKEIPLEPNVRMRGGAAIVLAFILLALAVLFLLNALAQDLSLLIASAIGLIALPLLVIQLDKRRRSRGV